MNTKALIILGVACILAAYLGILPIENIADAFRLAFSN